MTQNEMPEVIYATRWGDDENPITVMGIDIFDPIAVQTKYIRADLAPVPSADAQAALDAVDTLLSWALIEPDDEDDEGIEDIKMLKFKAKTIERALLQRTGAPDGWNFNMDEAPKGDDWPYSKVSDNQSEYVIVWNGHHRGVACQVSNYERDGYEWYDEGGNPVEPKPIAWQPLPAAPKFPDTDKEK